MGSSEPDAYRRVARGYDVIFGRMNAGLRGLGLKMLPPREGMNVLDVGCGVNGNRNLTSWRQSKIDQLGVIGRRLCR